MYCGAKFDKLQPKDQFDGFHGAIFRRSWICFSDVSSASHWYSSRGEQRASLTPSSAVTLDASGERNPTQLLPLLCQKESAVTAALLPEFGAPGQSTSH